MKLRWLKLVIEMMIWFKLVAKTPFSSKSDQVYKTKFIKNISETCNKVTYKNKNRAHKKGLNESKKLLPLTINWIVSDLILFQYKI